MPFPQVTIFPALADIRFARARALRFALWATAALLAGIMLSLWAFPDDETAGSVQLVHNASPHSGPSVQAASVEQQSPAVAPITTPSDIGQIRVHGVLSTGAAFSLGNGRQRFVAIGREISPGIRLVSVQRLFVTIDQGGSQVRIRLEGTPLAAEQSTSQATAASHDRPFMSSTPAARQRQVLDLRLGMAPEMEGDRIKGFRVKPGASLPFLSAAGLRPGDVIISLNNEPIRSTERLMELPAEIEAIKIAKIAPPEIQYLRNGKIMSARVN